MHPETSMRRQPGNVDLEYCKKCGNGDGSRTTTKISVATKPRTLRHVQAWPSALQDDNDGRRTTTTTSVAARAQEITAVTGVAIDVGERQRRQQDITTTTRVAARVLEDETDSGMAISV